MGRSFAVSFDWNMNSAMIAMTTLSMKNMKLICRLIDVQPSTAPRNSPTATT